MQEETGFVPMHLFSEAVLRFCCIFKYPASSVPHKQLIWEGKSEIIGMATSTGKKAQRQREGIPIFLSFNLL